MDESPSSHSLPPRPWSREQRADLLDGGRDLVRREPHALHRGAVRPGAAAEVDDVAPGRVVHQLAAPEWGWWTFGILGELADHAGQSSVEAGAGRLEVLGQHLDVGEHGHEVRVAAPARHDVLVQVARDRAARDRAEVPADVESLRPVGRRERRERPAP